jgi:hypothetical protein
MSLETVLAIGSAVISVGGVIVGLMKVTRTVTQVEGKITADIKTLGESTTADLKSLEASHTASMSRLEASTSSTIAHQTEIANLRHNDNTARIARIEDTLNKITKIVVYDGKG